MAALTLAMNEIQDVDPEDFVTLRAYCVYGTGYRRALLRRTSSPVSDSSGVYSAAASPSIGNSGSRSPSISSASSPDPSTEDAQEENSAVRSVEKVYAEYKKQNLSIIYDDRNILNLAQNVKPLSWQTTSPMYDYTKSTLTEYENDNNQLDNGFVMDSCCQCDFTWPLSPAVLRQNRKQRVNRNTPKNNKQR